MVNEFRLLLIRERGTFERICVNFCRGHLGDQNIFGKIRIFGKLPIIPMFTQMLSLSSRALLL